MNETARYDRMLTAIDECFCMMEAELDTLPPAEQLQICARIASAGSAVESQVTTVRIRAESGYCALLRAAAGLPPKNQREAKLLDSFE